MKEAAHRKVEVRTTYMGNPAEEKTVFAGFIKEAPLFADIAVKQWDRVANDPPDIKCDLENGCSVGVELTSWLDEIQISEAKRRETLENSFEKLLRWEPNNTENFRLIWLSARRRLQSSDWQTFRSELLTLVGLLDKRWPAEPDWQSPQGFQWNDFSNFPTLARYLIEMHIYPWMRRPRSTGQIGWLTFPARGGSYSPDSMVDALYDCVKAKIDKYSAKLPKLDKLYLLVHYDRAFVYNSPAEGIEFGYGDAIDAVRTRVGLAVGVFDRIFVYVSVNDGPKVFRMYPE